MAVYNNLPTNKPINSDRETIQAFDTYYNQPLEIKASTFDSMKSFFTAKGFDDVSSESIAVVIIRQAKIDNLNPTQILDTLKGLDSVEISALVAEIVNFNRFKTSFLGYARDITFNEEVTRNVLP